MREEFFKILVSSQKPLTNGTKSSILGAARVLDTLLKIYFVIGIGIYYQGFLSQVNNKCFLEHLCTLANLPLWPKFVKSIFRGVHI